MYVCSWLHCHNVNKTFTISHKTSALFIQELVTLRALETRCMPFQIGSYLEDKLVVNLTSTSYTSSHFVEAASSIGGCCCGWRNWRCCPCTCKKSTKRLLCIIRSVNTCENIHSNLNIANKSIRSFLFTISNNSIYQM